MIKLNKKGFTLIELLVVIAIIGLLSTLAVVSLNNARSKARDARRVSDLKTLQSAIELYKADFNDGIFSVPPGGADVWATIGTTAGSFISPSTYVAGLSQYLPGGMPVDPTNSGSQIYTLCTYPTNKNFFLYTVLENAAPSAGSVGPVDVNWVNIECINSLATATNVDPGALVCGTTNFCLGDITK